MYKIKAPSEEYDRKIGGVQFVNGEAQTDNEWLASWFSGRAGFTVETVTAEEDCTAMVMAAPSSRLTQGLAVIVFSSCSS